MKFLYFTLFALAAYFIYYGFRSYFLIQLSSQLVKKAVPYSLESDNMSVSILILGDSTAVGVGAEKSNDSIAGRLAEKVKATYIENHGVSGARVDDVFEQLKNVKHQKYDYIILQVGANDMVRLSGLDEVARKYESILSLLPQGDHLIALSCGNLGGAAFFPWPINLVYEKISRNYHARLQMLVEKYNGDYIQLFVEREIDPFVLEPEKYLAEDVFHPSSIGYADWFSKIELVVDKYTEK